MTFMLCPFLSEFNLKEVQATPGTSASYPFFGALTFYVVFAVVGYIVC